MNSENEISCVYVNLPKVAADQRLCSLAKVVAYRLMQNPYMTLKQFFTQLSDSDLRLLSEYVEAIHIFERSAAANMSADSEPVLSPEYERALRDLLVLIEMLRMAESSDTDPNDATKRESDFNYFCTVIAAVSLERKGLVVVNYDNLTFDEEGAQLPFVRLRE